MDIRKFRKQLGRYIKGTSNETETAIIEAWYKSYQSEHSEQLSDHSYKQIRQAMQQQIGKAIHQTPARSWSVYRIAASILLVSGLGLLAYHFTKPAASLKTTFITIQTQAGQVKQFVLPDSSVIWVNAASKVRVPSTYNDAVRLVYLDEGEAFFEVKHNRLKPFKVTTLPLQVQVLGTSFNIKAYKALPQLNVTVSTGKVGVSRGSKLLSYLTPGRQLSYIRTNGLFTQKTVTALESQSWKDGDTYLNHVKFEELSLVFKNMYGLSLKAGSKRVHDYLFTLRIKRKLEDKETLKLISLMHNAHFRKEGNEVILY
jgi:transmembrane sensor